MNKKSQVSRYVVGLLLILIVIVILAVIFVPKLFAQSEFFRGIAKTLGLSTEKEEKFTELADRVSKIKENPAIADALISEIRTEISNLEPSEQYLLNRLRELEQEANANKQYGLAAVDFNKLEYDGKKTVPEFQSQLNDYKNKFDAVVKQYPNNAVASEAAEKSAFIGKIVNCDGDTLNGNLCSPSESKGFCIKWQKPNIVLSGTTETCGFASCKKATEDGNLDLCTALRDTLGRCIPSKLSTDRLFCKECIYVSSCNEYIKDDCSKNACKLQPGCKWLEALPIEFSHCIAICSNLKSSEECQTYYTDCKWEDGLCKSKKEPS